MARSEQRLALLLALVEEDERVRADLIRSGALFGGYHPRMEAVHVANAQALSTVVSEGWPTLAEVGDAFRDLRLRKSCGILVIAKLVAPAARVNSPNFRKQQAGCAAIDFTTDVVCHRAKEIAGREPRA